MAKQIIFAARSASEVLLLLSECVASFFALGYSCSEQGQQNVVSISSEGCSSHAWTVYCLRAVDWLVGLDFLDPWKMMFAPDTQNRAGSMQTESPGLRPAGIQLAPVVRNRVKRVRQALRDTRRKE